MSFEAPDPPASFEGNPQPPGGRQQGTGRGGRAIEDDIRTIPGVVDCRVVWDSEGQLSEVHVIARGERPAKMIARDIQTLLLVNHDLTVPYQKVSIVNLGRPPRRAGRAPGPQAPDRAMEPQGPAPETPHTGAAGSGAPAGTAAALSTQTPAATRSAPSLPPALPWHLEGVQLRLREGQVEVTVQLVSDTGDRVQGRSLGPTTRRGWRCREPGRCWRRWRAGGNRAGGPP